MEETKSKKVKQYLIDHAPELATLSIVTIGVIVILKTRNTNLLNVEKLYVFTAESVLALEQAGNLATIRPVPIPTP